MSNLTSDVLLSATEEVRAEALAIHEQLADDGKYWSILREALAGDGPEVRLMVRTLARALEIDSYLEIGVWRGWCMAQVAAERPTAKLVGVDAWVKNFAGVDNPGPEFVKAQVKKVAGEVELKLLSGRSQAILPVALGGATFDLILLDGQRTTDGMEHDLKVASDVLNDGGAIVFDDLVPNNEGGPRTARQMWDSFKAARPDWSFVEVLDGLTPFGVAVKPGRKQKVKATVEKPKATVKKKATSPKDTTQPASS